jgi:AcrR family transcriptional regulator
MTEQARTRNPWGRGDRLRAEILDAASGLVDRLGGADAITIRGVARAAGIAPASIYQHFADRTALISGLVEHDSKRLLAVMALADDATADSDPGDRLRAQLTAYAKFVLENPGHYRLMLTLQEHRRQVSSRAVVNSIAAALERCQQAGWKLRLPVDRAAVMIFVAAHGCVALFHAEPEAGELKRALVFLDELLGLVLERNSRA